MAYLHFFLHFQASVEAPAADGQWSGALCHSCRYQYSHYSSLWCNVGRTCDSVLLIIFVFSRKGRALPVVCPAVYWRFVTIPFIFVLRSNARVSASPQCPWKVNIVPAVVCVEPRVFHLDRAAVGTLYYTQQSCPSPPAHQDDVEHYVDTYSYGRI